MSHSFRTSFLQVQCTGSRFVVLAYVRKLPSRAHISLLHKWFFGLIQPILYSKKIFTILLWWTIINWDVLCFPSIFDFIHIIHIRSPSPPPQFFLFILGQHLFPHLIFWKTVPLKFSDIVESENFFLGSLHSFCVFWEYSESIKAYIENTANLGLSLCTESSRNTYMRRHKDTQNWGGYLGKYWSKMKFFRSFIFLQDGLDWAKNNISRYFLFK